MHGAAVWAYRSTGRSPVAPASGHGANVADACGVGMFETLELPWRQPLGKTLLEQAGRPQHRPRLAKPTYSLRPLRRNRPAADREPRSVDSGRRRVNEPPGHRLTSGSWAGGCLRSRSSRPHRPQAASRSGRSATASHQTGTQCESPAVRFGPSPYIRRRHRR